MVAVYPYVGDRERDAALRRIAQRHLRCEDPRWSEAGADGDDAARDVLKYLRGRHTQLPRWVSTDDARDALVLGAWIYWDERRRERELIRRARGYGHSLGDIGAFLGLNTRQATYDYLDRLDALLEAHVSDQSRQVRVADERVEDQRALDGLPRDPDLVSGPLGTSVLPRSRDLYRRTRGRRASEAGADPELVREPRRRRQALPAREQWLGEHQHEIDSVLGDLLAQVERLGIRVCEQESDDLELEDLLAVLAHHRAATAYSPATLAALGLALDELRLRPDVAALARNHGAHQAAAAADRLRARYASLG